MEKQNIYLDTFLEKEFIPKYIKTTKQGNKTFSFVYFSNIIDYSRNPDIIKYIINYLYDHRIFINNWGLGKLISDTKDKREEVINKFVAEQDPQKRIIYRNDIFLLHLKVIKYFSYKYASIHKLPEEDVYSYLCEKCLHIIEDYNNNQKSSRKKDNSTRFLNFFAISINNVLASFPRNGLGITNLVILDALNNSKYIVEREQSEVIGKRITLTTDKEMVYNFITYLETKGTFSGSRECMKRVLPIRFSDSLEDHISSPSSDNYFEKIEDDSIKESIIKILDNFPAEYNNYKIAFKLKYLYNVKANKEIGKIMGISHELARTYISRATELIKESIQNNRITVGLRQNSWRPRIKGRKK